MAERRSSSPSDSSCVGRDTSTLPIREAKEKSSKGRKMRLNGKKDVKKKTLCDLKMEPNTPDAAPFADEKKGIGVRSNEPEMKAGPSVYSQVMAHLSKDQYSTPVRCVTPVRSRPAAKPRKRPGRREKKGPLPTKAGEPKYDAEQGKLDDSWMGNDEGDIGSLDSWLSRAGVKLDGAKMRDLLIVWQRAQQYQARNHGKESTTEKAERGKEPPSVSSEALEKLTFLVKQVERVGEEIRGGNAGPMPEDVLDRFKTVETMVSKTRRDVKLIGVKALANQTERLEAILLDLKGAVEELTGMCSDRQSSQEIQGLLKEEIMGPLMNELTKRWKGEFVMLREEVRALRRDNKKIRDEIRSLDFSVPEQVESVPAHDVEGEMKEIKTVLMEMRKNLDKALASKPEHQPPGEFSSIQNPNRDCCSQDGEQDVNQEGMEKGQKSSTVGVAEVDGEMEGSTGSVNNGVQQQESTPEASDEEIVQNYGNETPRGNVLFKNDLFNDPIPERTVIHLRAGQTPEAPVETAKLVFHSPPEKVSFVASMGWVDREHGSGKTKEEEDYDRMVNTVNEIVKEVEAGEENIVEQACTEDGAHTSENSANKKGTSNCFQHELSVKVGQRVQEESFTNVSNEVISPEVADTNSQHSAVTGNGGNEGNQQSTRSFGKDVNGPDVGLDGKQLSTGTPPLHVPADAGELDWSVNNSTTKPQEPEVGLGSGHTIFGEGAKENQECNANQDALHQMGKGNVMTALGQSMETQVGEGDEMSSLDRGVFNPVGEGDQTAGLEQSMSSQVVGEDQVYDNEEDMVDQVGPEDQIPISEEDILGQTSNYDQIFNSGQGLCSQVGNEDQIPIFGQAMFNQMGKEDERHNSGQGIFAQMGNDDPIPSCSRGIFAQLGEEDPIPSCSQGIFPQLGEKDPIFSCGQGMFAQLGEEDPISSCGQDMFAQVGEDDHISNFGEGFSSQCGTEDENTNLGQGAFGQDDTEDQSSNPEEDIFGRVGKDIPEVPSFGQKDMFDQLGEEDRSSNFEQNMFGLGCRDDQCFEGINGVTQPFGKENQFSMRESMDAMLCDEDTWPDWGLSGNRNPLQNAGNVQKSTSDSSPDGDDMVDMEERGEVKFDDENGKRNIVEEPMLSRIPTLRGRATDGQGFPMQQSKLRPPKKTAFDIGHSFSRMHMP